MPISVRCPECETKIRVKDAYAGKTGRCPSCKGAVKIPAAAANTEPLRTEKTRITRKRKASRTSNTNKPETKAQSRRSSSAAMQSEVAQPDAGADEDLLGFSMDDLRSEGESVQTERPARSRQGSDSMSRSKPRRAATKIGESTEARKKIRERVIKGFSGSIDPVRRTLLYRIGVILAACFVVILPLLYLALIAFAGWGVYWHATDNVSIASMGRGRGRVVAVMAYAAPIIAGSIAVLFMLKPLLAPKAERGGRISLHRQGQPLLFEFVERICDAVKAPRPSRIDLTFDINASAGYSGGLFSVLRSDLVLTIGLPLVAGMQLQHFSGILAHEFGHFSQGAAMRVSWVVRSINHWFARVVYVRDEWDEWLVEASEETDIRIGWIFHIARFSVFLSRGILWCFMFLSAAATSWLARQMEFDADRYEARLAGSEEFEETSFRLHCLAYGMQEFFKDMMIRQQAEPENGNPIRSIVQYCDALSDHDLKRIRKNLRKDKTGLMDTHPANSARVENAKKEDTEGVFKSNLPAEAVFQKFDQLCVGMLRA